MLTLELSTGVIIVVGVVHVLITIWKREPKRIVGDDFIDALGGVILAGIYGPANSNYKEGILVTVILLNIIVATCYLPKFLRFGDNKALLREATIFSLIVACASVLLTVIAIL